MLQTEPKETHLLIVREKTEKVQPVCKGNRKSFLEKTSCKFGSNSQHDEIYS